jgi:hypothetical protein
MTVLRGRRAEKPSPPVSGSPSLEMGEAVPKTQAHQRPRGSPRTVRRCACASWASMRSSTIHRQPWSRTARSPLRRKSASAGVCTASGVSRSRRGSRSEPLAGAISRGWMPAHQCPVSEVSLRWPGPAGAWLRSRSPAYLQYAGLPAALPVIQRSSGHRQRTSATRHQRPRSEVRRC